MNTALSLRRRGNWEAVDSGILLWQQNWPALLLFFGVPCALCTAASFFLPNDGIKIAGYVLLWLKPFFDRFALHVISIRFFEPDARFGRLFKGLGKTLRRGIIGDLLWRRFSLFRSARMPVLVLEGLKGKALKKRREILSPRGLHFGFPVTLICMALEYVLSLGELAFFYGILDLFQPGYLDFWSWIEEASRIFLAVEWFNRLFVETLFVCMGFGLYINARVETEGWDIELLFKRCTAKAKHSVPKALCLALALFLVPVKSFAENKEGGRCFHTGTNDQALIYRPPYAPAAFGVFRYPPGAAFLSGVETGSAETAEPANPGQFTVPPLPGESAALLDGVLKSEDFGQEKPGWTIRPKEKKQESGFKPRWRNFDLPWIKEALGIAVRTILVLSLACILLWSARYFYRRRGFSPYRNPRHTSRRVSESIDDPDALLDAAVLLHGEGKIREAWALCFRAFIAALSRRWGIGFPPETTEYEALAIAGGRNEAFPRFVARWIDFAYGGKIPPAGDFENALSDCRLVLKTNPEEGAP